MTLPFSLPLSLLLHKVMYHVRSGTVLYSNPLNSRATALLHGKVSLSPVVAGRGSRMSTSIGMYFLKTFVVDLVLNTCCKCHD